MSNDELTLLCSAYIGCPTVWLIGIQAVAGVIGIDSASGDLIQTTSLDLTAAIDESSGTIKLQFNKAKQPTVMALSLFSTEVQMVLVGHEWIIIRNKESDYMDRYVELIKDNISTILERIDHNG